MITIIRCLILLLSLSIPALATVPVVRYPSGTPVQVCQPSDSNPSCGVGMGTSAPGGVPTNIQYNNNGTFGGVLNSSADTNGNVGIGTNSSQASLTLAGTASQFVFSGAGLDDFTATGVYDNSFGAGAIIQLIIDGVNGINAFTVTTAGTGYIGGDTVGVAGGSGAVCNVDSVNGGGGITAMSCSSPGTGYTIAAHNVTGGTGTGGQITISSLTDTVTFNVNGSPLAVGYPLTSFPINVAGFNISFGATIGHTLTNSWTDDTGTGGKNPLNVVTPSGLDDLTSSGNYDGGDGTPVIFKFVIDGNNGSSDLVDGYVNGILINQGVALSTFPITSDSLTFSVGAQTGHIQGDSWSATVTTGNPATFVYSHVIPLSVTPYGNLLIPPMALSGRVLTSDNVGTAKWSVNVPPTGNGVLGEVTYWTGTNSIGGSAGFTWDPTTSEFNIPNIGTSTAGIFTGGSPYIFSPANGTFCAGGSCNMTTTGQVSVAVGSSALHAVTSGSNNVAVGEGAMNHTTTGQQNTAVGHEALLNNTSGNGNTVVGSDAVTQMNTASNLVAIGLNSMVNITGGNNLVGIGTTTLAVNSSGDNNIAIGNETLRSNTTGAHNTSIGVHSQDSSGTSSFNTTVGDSAMHIATAGDGNVALGYQALYSNSIGGDDNIAIGRFSMNGNGIGDNNIAMGRLALSGNTTGNHNIAIGPGALVGQSSGDGEIAIGQDALSAVASLGGDIAIGHDAIVNKSAGSEETIAIGTAAGAGPATDNGCVSIGTNNLSSITPTCTANTAIGNHTMDTVTSGSFNTHVGYHANSNIASTGSQDVSIGAFTFPSLTSGSTDTAIGYNSGLGVTSGLSNTYIGFATGTSSGSSVGGIAIGYQALTTGSNQLVIGGDTAQILNTYIGEGVTNATPPSNTTIHGTGGVGTDVVGSNLTFSSGIGTGAAIPSTISFQSTIAGSTGTTAQTVRTLMQINTSDVILSDGLTLHAQLIGDADYNLLLTDTVVIFLSQTAPRVVNLPDWHNVTNGKTYTIKTPLNASLTNTITLTPLAGQFIENQATFVMNAPSESITVIMNNGGWWII